MAKPKGKSTAKIVTPDTAAQQHKSDYISKHRAHKQGLEDRRKQHKQGMQDKIKGHRAGLPKAGGFGEKATKLTRPGDTGGHFGKMPSKSKSKPTGLDGKEIKDNRGQNTPNKLENVVGSDAMDVMAKSIDMDENIILSLNVLDARLEDAEDDIEDIYKILDDLEDQVDEFITPDDKRELDPPDEEVTAGLDAYFFKAEVFSPTQIRIVNTPLRIGRNFFNDYTNSPWEYDGYSGGVLHNVPLDQVGTFFLCFEVSFGVGVGINFKRFRFIHEYIDYLDGLKRPDLSDSDLNPNAIYWDNTEGVPPERIRYWREFICTYTISAGVPTNSLTAVRQIWPGHMMSVNDRIV